MSRKAVLSSRMTDEAPVMTTARRVHSGGVSILVVTFTGEVGFGCRGNGDARKMADDLEAFLDGHEDVEALVLDGTQLAYRWGDEIGRVHGRGRPYVWAVSEATSGLVSYFAQEMNLQPSEWLLPSVDAAIAEVSLRAMRESVDFHNASGEVCERWQREPRGRRELSYQENICVLETLTTRTGTMVERIRRDEQGEIEVLVEWPFLDARGEANEACRMDARLVFERSVLRTIDFNPQQTRRKLPRDWLSRIATAPAVKEVVLDRTGVSDNDVADLLKRCPGIEKLSLNEVELEGTFLQPPSPAERLREVDLFGKRVPDRVGVRLRAPTSR